MIIKNSSISLGDSSNSNNLRFLNHSGTHIDFPYHFSDTGKSINDYSPAFWSFSKIHVVKVRVGIDEIIDEIKLSVKTIPGKTEFLIIQTGFESNRNRNVYWKNNPGISPQLANKLKLQCPNIKVLGFDFISLSSYQNRALGRKAHIEFLVNHDILIIEDMKLDQLVTNKIKEITALPLLVDGIDGSPITIIATI
jgi:arylformamidase